MILQRGGPGSGEVVTPWLPHFQVLPSRGLCLKWLIDLFLSLEKSLQLLVIRKVPHFQLQICLFNIHIMALGKFQANKVLWIELCPPQKGYVDT